MGAGGVPNVYEAVSDPAVQSSGVCGEGVKVGAWGGVNVLGSALALLFLQESDRQLDVPLDSQQGRVPTQVLHPLCKGLALVP
jgi:hypothetical protein